MRSAFSPEELYAVHLADPVRLPRESLPESAYPEEGVRTRSAYDLQSVVRILQKNKVPLLSLPESARSLALRDDPLFQEACQAEAQQLAGLRGEYELVREACADAGIRGVLIKSVGLRPSFPFKSDNLDVLYEPGDTAQVKAVLRRLGYIELKNVEEPHKYLFRKFHTGRSVSAIHLHEHVGWMVSFLDEERLWQRCRPAGDDPLLVIPAAEDALLTNLAHWFYEDKRLTLQDVAKCAYCLRQGVDWDEVYRIATWRGWRDGLNVSLLLYAYQECALYGETLVPLPVLARAGHDMPARTRVLLERYAGADALAALERGQWDKRQACIRKLPLPVPFYFSKLLFYAKLVRDPTRNTSRKVKDWVVHTLYGTKLRLHIHSQPAMLVTFSGVDGCGKTTQARALQSAFEACHLRINYVWSRGGSAGWITYLTGRSKRRRIPPRGGTPFAPGGEDPTGEYLTTGGQTPQTMEVTVQARKLRFRSPAMRWAWSWLTTMELLLQYAKRVALPLILGHVVICDRYVYDALADWSAYFDDSAIEKRGAAQVLRFMAPHPRIAYWVDVPAEVAQSRSTDGVPAAFLTAQSAVYGRLADLPQRGGTEYLYALRRLDGRRPWEEISDEVVRDVLDTYFATYHTWINTLFMKNPGQWK